MSGAGLTTEAKIGGARKAVSDRPSWLGWLGRLGMAAAGFLYCLIGFLAVELALGAGGRRPTGRERYRRSPASGGAPRSSS